VLQKLHIRNIALIEELDIDFQTGFHVFTGETGAGKSIIIDAVNLVLGERANRDLIKTGASKAYVEAVFSADEPKQLLSFLEQEGIEPEDDTLILARELSASGKSTCRINGVLVNLSTLKSIGDQLIDVHGQHAHQSLLQPGEHLSFLDDFFYSETRELKQNVSRAYSNMRQMYKQLHSGFLSEQDRLMRIDLLQYQINEIESASLREGEEEELQNRRMRLLHAERIMQALEQSYEALLDGEANALVGIKEAASNMDSIANMDEVYQNAAARLQEIYYDIEDIAYSIRDCKNEFDYRPDMLEEVEQRLETVYALKRKYGTSIRAILDYYGQIAEELQQLHQNDALKERLQSQYASLCGEYNHLSEQLSCVRKEAAIQLEKKLKEQLRDLGLSKCEFQVMFTRLEEGEWNADGKDKIEFFIATNPGEPLKPLNRVVSGGELSRIMLALKTISSNRTGVPTLIFDEVDTGVSGQMASAVGEKMMQIASTHQVLCITHLAQIASMADVHFLVEKIQQHDHTRSSVRVLTTKERCVELSHIMGTKENSALGLQHAQELLDMAQKKKAQVYKKDSI